jgi:transcriptional regulator with XRE-family HTH domain
VHAPLTSFGARLRAARDAAGITQTALGERTGFGHRSIVRYEAGGALPSVQAAAILAQALGTSLDELAGLSSASDPELARMVAQLHRLGDQDRAMARHLLAVLFERAANK